MKKQAALLHKNILPKMNWIARIILQPAMCLWSVSLWGQTTAISDSAARAKYDQCWKFFEKGKILNCYNCSVELRKQMGRPTLKVNSMIAETGTALLPNMSTLSEIEQYNDSVTDMDLKISYKTVREMKGYIDELMRFLKPQDTTELKHELILEQYAIIQHFSKVYDTIKNQKPEDLVRFLNNCAEKFKKHYGFWGKTDAHYVFRLEKEQLIIDMNGKDDQSTKAKFRTATLGQMIIDLKAVWIEEQPVNNIKNAVDYSIPFSYRPDSYVVNGIKDKDNSGPVIKSASHTDEMNALVYDRLLTKSAYHYDRVPNFPQLRFDGEVPRPAKEPLYIYQMFDQSSRAFIEGAYRTRIRDAFEMLIEHFGGGEPK